MRRVATAIYVAFVALACTRAAAEPPGSPEQPPALVVFVCEHGNVKSLMAASYFNEFAKQRGLPFRGVSRGSAPDATPVPRAIADAMRAEGFDVSGFQPSAVSAAEMAASARVVTIGTALPSADTSKVEQWNDVPPASTAYVASSAALKAHVEDLLERLVRSSP